MRKRGAYPQRNRTYRAGIRVKRGKPRGKSGRRLQDSFAERTDNRGERKHKERAKASFPRDEC